MARTSVLNATKALLESIQNWVDRSDYDDVDEMLQTIAPARLREREQIVKRIVFAISDRLEHEAAAMPGKALLVPPIVVVYLDSDENLRWINQARRWLIEGINEATAQRVREMHSFDPGRTQIPKVDLREDSDLEPGGIRVEPAWDTTRKPTTAAAGREGVLSKHFEPLDGEPTIVKDALSPIYRVDVWKGGQQCGSASVRTLHALIGRGTPTTAVDVQLPDPTVSRIHARVDKEINGFWITSIGKNRLRVNGRALYPRHRIKVRPGEPIEISNFTLRIVPSL